MALSNIIKKNCKVCGKVAVEKSRITFGSSKVITLECGHVTTEEVMQETDYGSIISKDGRQLMPYQIEGVKFLERANASAILADEQGLGKTIEVLALLKLHREKLTPAVIVVPTNVKIQWHHEIVRWCGVDGFLTQVISSGKEFAAPGFDIYITTYDLLKKDDTFKYVKDNIKFVVIDECQRIKDHLSGRAKAVQKICKNVEHILPMSGTPIKNHAGEYFTVLNLVRPRMFSQYLPFIETYTEHYNSGYGYKVGGLKNPERFHEITKDFILRRTKNEVLKDLPQLSRRFYHVDFDPKLKAAYEKALKELEEAIERGENSPAIIAIMSRMRQITGNSKVDPAVDFVTEFLLSSERKIVLFVHHHTVAQRLEANLNSWMKDGGFAPVLMMHSGLSAEQRSDLAEQFKHGPNRVMIASTLASGEGINLQFCSDAIMVERQWNPANEEQAEARFHRFGQENPVTITYMIALGTIDEYFTEIVETKRGYMSSTLDNKAIQWSESNLMRELAEVLVTKGKRGWKL